MAHAHEHARSLSYSCVSHYRSMCFYSVAPVPTEREGSGSPDFPLRRCVPKPGRSQYTESLSEDTQAKASAEGTPATSARVRPSCPARVPEWGLLPQREGRGRVRTAAPRRAGAGSWAAPRPSLRLRPGRPPRPAGRSVWVRGSRRPGAAGRPDPEPRPRSPPRRDVRGLPHLPDALGCDRVACVRPQYRQEQEPHAAAVAAGPSTAPPRPGPGAGAGCGPGRRASGWVSPARRAQGRSRARRFQRPGPGRTWPAGGACWGAGSRGAGPLPRDLDQGFHGVLPWEAEETRVEPHGVRGWPRVRS